MPTRRSTLIALGALALGAAARARAAPSLDVKDFGALADWDGNTGTNNTGAFTKAFAALKAAGGGTLLVPPGDYHFGAHARSVNVVKIEGLSNATIAAEGARFLLNTTAISTPFLFVFINPNNVTFSGGTFVDVGFNAAAWDQHKRWGMGAVRLDATIPSKGFTLTGCSAENVTMLLVADLRANKRKLSDISVIDCKVRTAYYGVDVLYVGDRLKIVNLDCIDVRRGLISFGLRNAEADLKLYSSPGFAGSNAFISLASEGTAFDDGHGVIGDDADVDNVKLKLRVSGYEAHTAYVHFYHQQADSPGVIANVSADVRVENLSAKGKFAKLARTNVFLFDHELPGAKVAGKTQRSFRNIVLSGNVLGSVTGKPVMVTSVNPNRPHGIRIAPDLARSIKALETPAR